MKKITVLFFLLFVSFVWFQSCTPADKSCKKNADCLDSETCRGNVCFEKVRCTAAIAQNVCSSDEVCNNGFCVPKESVTPPTGECSSNFDCNSGKVCKIAEKKCVECIDNIDCKEQKKCVNNVCIVASTEEKVIESDASVEKDIVLDGKITKCSTHSDCAKGEACDFTKGICAPDPALACKEDNDCEGDHYCKDKTCTAGRRQCGNDSNKCEFGFICRQDGSCYRQNCKDQKDCLPTENCDSTQKKCIEKQVNCTQAGCPTGFLCNATTQKCEVDQRCKVDTDCGSDETCNVSSGKCIVKPKCTGDLDCKPTEICNLTTGKCVAPPTCASDADCTTTQVCLPSKLCGTGCKSDADCVSGQTCSSVSRQCEAKKCTTNRDCSSPLGTCRSGICQSCATQFNCASTEQCQLGTGTCVKTCNLSTDCAAPNGTCKNNACQSCVNDFSCVGSEICNQATGICQAKYCASDVDCQTTEYCKSSACKAKECDSTQGKDCLSGQYCLQYECKTFSRTSCTSYFYCKSTEDCVYYTSSNGNNGYKNCYQKCSNPGGKCANQYDCVQMTGKNYSGGALSSSYCVFPPNQKLGGTCDDYDKRCNPGLNCVYESSASDGSCMKDCTTGAGACDATEICAPYKDYKGTAHMICQKKCSADTDCFAPRGTCQNYCQSCKDLKCTGDKICDENSGKCAGSTCTNHNQCSDTHFCDPSTKKCLLRECDESKSQFCTFGKVCSDYKCIDFTRAYCTFSACSSASDVCIDDASKQNKYCYKPCNATSDCLKHFECVEQVVNSQTKQKVCILLPSKKLAEKCNRFDQRCNSGLLCVFQSTSANEGICTQLCTSDTDCQSTESCTATVDGKLCLPKCTTDADCSGSNGTCHSGTCQSCVNHFRCSGTAICNTTSGKCDASTCTTDSQCASDHFCKASACVPKVCDVLTNKVCVSGQICQQYECVVFTRKACSSDANCNGGQICWKDSDSSSGQCYEKCANLGQYCSNGMDCVEVNDYKKEAKTLCVFSPSRTETQPCNPVDERCNSGLTCLSHEIKSTRGLCYKNCATSVDCTGPTQCFSSVSPSVCMKSCSTSADCSAPTGTCENGICSSCLREYRCSGTDICNPLSGRCNATSCTEDIQCSSNHYCSLGLCKPKECDPNAGSNCKIGEVCELYKCQLFQRKSCSVDSDCTINQRCFADKMGTKKCFEKCAQAGQTCQQNFVCVEVETSGSKRLVCLLPENREENESCNDFDLRCKQGNICIQYSSSSATGICRKDCTVASCASNQSCVAEPNGVRSICVNKCSTDTDCSGGSSGTCFNGNCLSCANQFPCAAGKICDWNTGLCNASTCTEDAQCGTSHFCNVSGKCIEKECNVVGKSCVSGALCTNYQCIVFKRTACTSNSNCKSTERCITDFFGVGACFEKCVTAGQKCSNGLNCSGITFVDGTTDNICIFENSKKESETCDFLDKRCESGLKCGQKDPASTSYSCLKECKSDSDCTNGDICMAVSSTSSVCRPSGTGLSGDICGYSTNGCAKNFYCLVYQDTDTTGQCKRTCNPSATSAGCSASEECLALDTTNQFGVCFPNPTQTHGQPCDITKNLRCVSGTLCINTGGGTCLNKCTSDATCFTPYPTCTPVTGSTDKVCY